jgi:hypothetical protein
MNPCGGAYARRLGRTRGRRKIQSVSNKQTGGLASSHLFDSLQIRYLRRWRGNTWKNHAQAQEQTPPIAGRVGVCLTCGEQIVIPLDRSGGAEQSYVEDCPVCCNPNVIHVEFFGEGEPPRVWADAE